MTRLSLTAAALVLGLGAVPAVAQQAPCAERDKVVKRLGEKYGESVIVSGLSQAGAFEVFANRETGAWTVVITNPSGISCVPLTGENLELTPDAASPTGLKI